MRKAFAGSNNIIHYNEELRLLKNGRVSKRAGESIADSSASPDESLAARALQERLSLADAGSEKHVTVEAPEAAKGRLGASSTKHRLVSPHYSGSDCVILAGG